MISLACLLKPVDLPEMAVPMLRADPPPAAELDPPPAAELWFLAAGLWFLAVGLWFLAAGLCFLNSLPDPTTAVLFLFL